MERRGLGAEGEAAAAAFLEGEGYRIVERNFRSIQGEVDLIIRDGATLVFVEVKLRRTLRFGSPAEAVDPRKQDRIRRVALGYLAEHNLLDRVEVRFDVLGVEPGAEGYSFEHIKGAF